MKKYEKYLEKAIDDVYKLYEKVFPDGDGVKGFMEEYNKGNKLKAGLLYLNNNQLNLIIINKMVIDFLKELRK